MLKSRVDRQFNSPSFQTSLKLSTPKKRSKSVSRKKRRFSLNDGLRKNPFHVRRDHERYEIKPSWLAVSSISQTPDKTESVGKCSILSKAHFTDSYEDTRAAACLLVVIWPVDLNSVTVIQSRGPLRSAKRVYPGLTL